MSHDSELQINMEYYKVFYHVARLKSFTLAAEALYISQPAVSQSMKQLEEALGGALFSRNARGVTLTPEGEVLYTYVSKGYETLLAGERKFLELLNLETGEIRIGASDMTLQFYLLPHLERFHKLYPKIRIKITNAPTPVTIENLLDNKIDFGVVSSPIEARPHLSAVPVGRIEDIFIAGPKYDHLSKKELELDELTHYPIICLEQNTSTRIGTDTFLEKQGVVLTPEFELATSDLIVQFAARNLGIGCVMKAFAEKALSEGQVFQLIIRPPLPPRDILILTGSRSPISPAGKKLLNLLMP